jgi:hypothetical protein
MRKYGILAFVACLGACTNLTPAQQANLQLELDLAKQIGSTAVQIWCDTSGIVYVIAANEAGSTAATSKVVQTLQNNANAAAAACPMINGVTAVQVAKSAPTTAIQSPVTATTGG